MSLVYLMATNLLVMFIVLFTLSHRQLRKIAGYVALIAPIVTSTYFIMKIPDVIRNKFIAVQLPWMPSIDINLDLRLDGLSLMFGLIISLIGVGVFSMPRNIYLTVRTIFLDFHLFTIIYVQYDWHCNS